MLAHPVLIVESDDWGPGPDSDAVALNRIADILRHCHDRDGRPAVMTLGLVLGKPDGPAILADGCRSYHRNMLAATRYDEVVRAIKQGCDAGVFDLQRHGLEHCWPHSLLARAQHDESLRRWLADLDARSEGLPAELQSRWVDAATLPSRPLSEDAIARAVIEEAEAFVSLFGRAPAVAVPNTFVWNDAVEREWAETGVRCVVTCGRQYEARAANGELAPATRKILNGDSGLGGIRFVVRDAYFEPIRGHRAEQVWQALLHRTDLGRPTLVETHRANFVAEGDIQASLAELQRALAGARQRHPDLCFMTTGQLAEILGSPSAGLIERCGRRKAGIWLHRILADERLARPLKFTGLAALLAFCAKLVNFA